MSSARPTMGPTLIHVATMTSRPRGRRFRGRRMGRGTIFVIDRRALKVRRLEIPAIDGSAVADARRFR